MDNKAKLTNIVIKNNFKKTLEENEITSSEVKTWGDLKNILKLISGTKYGVGVFKKILGFVPGVSEAMSTIELLKKIMKLPDGSRNDSWLSKLDIDDDTARIVADDIELLFMEDKIKDWKNKPNNEDLPDDFNMNQELVNWLRDNFNNRTIAGIPVNEIDKKSKIKEALKAKLKKEMSMTGTGASVTPGTGEGVATKYAFGKKKDGNKVAKDYIKTFGGKLAPSVPNRPSKAMDYKKIWEGSDWPKEIPSRYADEFLFIHDDNKPGFYDVKDVATGKIVDRVGFRTPENAIYFANDKIKPQGGTRSTQLENESSLEIDDRVKVVYGNEFYGETGTIVDIKRGFVTVEMDRNGNEYSMHISDVQKIDDEDDDYDDDILDETHINTEFNINKVWDFIESRPFNNPNYMPKFNTAKEIWNDWGSKEKEMYANFDWKDIYGDKIHPREKAALQHQKNYDVLAGLNEIGFKSGKEFINIKLQKYPKALSKVNNLINMIGENNFTMDMAEWIWDFFNNASFESPISEESLLENYARFRNETKTRTKPEQFHSAVKEVKKKVNEINRLFEYMSRLQNELKESEGGLKTKKYTENALQQIKEVTKKLFLNSTKLK